MKGAHNLFIVKISLLSITLSILSFEFFQCSLTPQPQPPENPSGENNNENGNDSNGGNPNCFNGYSDDEDCRCKSDGGMNCNSGKICDGGTDGGLEDINCNQDVTDGGADILDGTDAEVTDGGTDLLIDYENNENVTREYLLIKIVNYN